MDSNNKTKNAASEKSGFWRRQWAPTITVSQFKYDIIFGVVMPILCFVFDPGIFADSGFRLELVPIAQYKLFVYLFSGASIITLLVWLLAYRTAKSAGAIAGGIIAGILMSGAAFSFVIGVLILPLTLLGLMLLIGVLGFTPFFTAFVYFRNFIRAMKLTEPYLRHPKFVGPLVLAALLIIALPYAVHTSINRVVSQAINDLMEDDPQVVDTAVRRLKWVRWAGDTDHLVWAYSKEQDLTRKQNLARAYKNLTGDDIDRRLAILLD